MNKSILFAHIQSLTDGLKSEPRGASPYIHGACASLALSLYKLMSESLPGLDFKIVALYRIERDIESGLESERTLSHVMLGLGLETIDINGWNAENRWCDHIEKNVPPYSSDFHNDIETVEFSGDDTVSKITELCAAYDVDLGDLDLITERLKSYR